MFEQIHKKFAKKDTDLYKLQQEEGFSRYILIRSLGVEHLKDLFSKYTGEQIKKGSADELYLKLYDSGVTEDEIIEYIKSKYPEVRDYRKIQEEFLPKIISEFTDVRCGIRNDDLNETAKKLVRDKSIKSKADLEKKVDEVFDATIRGYILWQYYNQVTNDLIEHILNDHINVIPTLRKISYVDFLIKKGDLIIPFDLKITHISDDYFDLHKKGLTHTDIGNDSFIIGGNKSESELIKEKYKSVKKELSLPNYGSLDKIEMLTILNDKGGDEIKQFGIDIMASRKKMIEEIPTNLKAVEWWNYKFQGERLFKNNNRFFIFLAYKDSFEDARPLKGKIEDIRAKVNEKLNSIIAEPLNNIKYYYNKDKGLEGPYEVNSTSVILTN
ncbi:hypothetical protein [Pedobacter frigiditerrae]|uniref:hypothetical protein n=1 Tax=Pedobacter frigiditerrae TaxID=2530452 RepID=UPI002931C062|nr:hypothetical protein [Pedobacter frigiditerrae]